MIPLEQSVVRFIDPSYMKKIALTKKIGSLFIEGVQAHHRSELENIARVLADDVSVAVRASLAFELRACDDIPADLAEIIARDIALVAHPFLCETDVLSDTQWEHIIPDISEQSRISLARRRDLSDRARLCIVQVADEETVGYMLRDAQIALPGKGYEQVVQRFGDSEAMMDRLSARDDLPIEIVVDIIDKVSNACRDTLLNTYQIPANTAQQTTDKARFDVMADRFKRASRDQLVGVVKSLKEQRRLTHRLILAMALRDAHNFVHVALAFRSGRTIADVRTILQMQSTSDFLTLMNEAETPRDLLSAFVDYALASSDQKDDRDVDGGPAPATFH